MNFFFGFDVFLKESIKWMFNLNHVLLLIFTVLAIVSLYFALHAKSEKGKKITKMIIALIMLVLETGRILYKILEHLHGNDSLDGFSWAWNISFQMCAIMCWTTIATLIASCFVKKDNRILVIFKNILFGAAMLGGILTFVYPDFLSGNRPLLHFVNIQTLLIHTLLIFVPVYLIKIKELNVRFKNLWMPVFGFIGIAAISSAASQVTAENFAFSLGNPLFSDVGLNITYPWHLPLTFIIIFMLPVLYYGIFELLHHKKNAKAQNISCASLIKTKLKNCVKATFSFKGIKDFILKFAPAIISIVCIFLILFIPVWQGINVSADITDFAQRSLHSWSGLIVLLPFIALIALIIIIKKIKTDYAKQ